MRKSPGSSIYELLDETSLPYSLMVWKNLENVWRHSWKYDKENQSTSDEEKEKYNRYKSMKAAEIATLSTDEREEWNEMRPKVGIFTKGVKKEPYKESYSQEGMEYYYKSLSRWRYFLKGGETKDMFDELWRSNEEKHRFGEIMFASTCARKRRKGPEDAERRQSPSSVMVMPGEDGYEEFLLSQAGYEYESV